jgi:hypothetical protein
MKSKRKAANSLQFFLWPDEQGLLRIPTNAGVQATARSITPRAGLSVSSSPRLLQLPRAPRRTISRLLFCGSLSLWLLQRSPVGSGFGLVRERIFVTWLSGVLESESFNALELERLISAASRDLGLDEETVKRYLVKHTTAWGEFRSDGVLVTLSDGRSTPSPRKTSAP